MADQKTLPSVTLGSDANELTSGELAALRTSLVFALPGATFSPLADLRDFSRQVVATALLVAITQDVLEVIATADAQSAFKKITGSELRRT